MRMYLSAYFSYKGTYYFLIFLEFYLVVDEFLADKVAISQKPFVDIVQ